jgi:hypothetical protein
MKDPLIMGNGCQDTDVRTFVDDMLKTNPVPIKHTKMLLSELPVIYWGLEEAFI